MRTPPRQASNAAPRHAAFQLLGEHRADRASETFHTDRLPAVFCFHRRHPHARQSAGRDRLERRERIPAQDVDQTEDQAGPFPTVGFDATYVISKRFYLDGRVAYFRANIDKLDGSLGFYELNALYRLRENISFALGYELVKAHLLSTQNSNSGLFDFSTQGPELFVRVAF